MDLNKLNEFLQSKLVRINESIKKGVSDNERTGFYQEREDVKNKAEEFSKHYQEIATFEDRSSNEVYSVTTTFRKYFELSDTVLCRG